ncbi:MAG: hypothetical protein ABJA74_12345, partial [Lapillicoccus sp.]
VLAAADDGVENAMEGRYLHHVERPHGLPAGVRQHRRESGGRERHDVGYPDQRVLVELDGRLGHEASRRRSAMGVEIVAVSVRDG